MKNMNAETHYWSKKIPIFYKTAFYLINPSLCGLLAQRINLPLQTGAPLDQPVASYGQTELLSSL